MMTSTQASVRSPSYPNMSLRDALIAVRKIESEYRSSPADREHAAKLIGYSSLSGPAAKALAALAHYGLVERAGKGELKVSELAVRIIHPNDGNERNEGLHTAALAPRLFAELSDRWPDIRPPLDGVMTYLRRQGFNESAIKPAASAYLETLSFIEEARASESHGHADKKDEESPSLNSGEDSPKFGGAKVGDLVQWESGGVLQFQKPKRVRWISEDGDYLAVDGSQTSLPMSQAVVERSGLTSPDQTPVPPAEDFTPTSVETDYKVVKHGNKLTLSGTTVGADGIDKLMAELKLYKQMLELDGGTT